jgi:hypothetical protein
VESAGGLPFVDEQTWVIAAPAAAVWRAIEQVMTGPPGRAARRYGRLVGVRGERAFEVDRAEPPRRLVLVGEHRFARYALDFTIEYGGPGISVLMAETRAEFPGAAGRLYRALVIGSRAHAMVVRRLLARIARRAERAATAPSLSGPS